MITDDGVIIVNDLEKEYDEVIMWAHQCWQLLYTQIDLAEFKRRMNVSSIDYNKFMADYADKLEQNNDSDKIYMLRVMHVLYPETYPNPDQE